MKIVDASATVALAAAAVAATGTAAAAATATAVTTAAATGATAAGVHSFNFQRFHSTVKPRNNGFQGTNTFYPLLA